MFVVPAQRLLRETVRKFALDTIGPLVKQMDKAGELERTVLQGLFSAGLMGVEIPECYKGAGLKFSDSMIVIHEVARVDPSVATLVDIHNTLINKLINKYGDNEQKEQLLPRCATECVGSFCLTEESSGSDAFALKTCAVPVDDGWEITGEKQFVSNSSEAEFFIVFATENMEMKHKGISTFVVFKNDKRVKLGPPIKKLGIRCSSCRSVSFNRVFVPRKWRVGETGDGYRHAMSCLNEGRIGIAAQMTGLAAGALDLTIPYIKSRIQFGQTLTAFQGIRFQVAKMGADLAAAHALVMDVALEVENNRQSRWRASAAKLVASKTAQEVASQCVDLFGGYGYCEDFLIEKFYRDSKIGSIYEGTSNIQMETIAKGILASDNFDTLASDSFDVL